MVDKRLRVDFSGAADCSHHLLQVYQKVKLKCVIARKGKKERRKEGKSSRVFIINLLVFLSFER